MTSTSYRDLTCAAARLEDVGRTVTLAGWVNRRRDMGQLIFIDLRDRYGTTQVVADATDAPEAHAAASDVRSEFVIQVHGTVVERLPGTAESPSLATGDVEVRADRITVLGPSRTPPFVINDPDAEVDEAVRLTYRYLDLRREPLQQRILARGRLVQAIREAHHEAGFVEVETPLLIKSTPEGARDFIVPSRLQPGHVYALPQSPQQLKQLLMVSGMDRYFQIARCLRDEDLRGDRQPEFTQLDLEMSFVDRGRRHGLGRGDGDRGHASGRARAAHPRRALPAAHVARGDRPVRLGQAGPALRPRAARPRRRGRRLGVPRVRGGPRGGWARRRSRGAGHGGHESRAASTS